MAEPARWVSTHQRHEQLLHLLRAGVVRVEDLAARTEVSESTVRRDLARLEDEGLVARTYGGARPAAPFREVALAERMTQEVAAKARIGAAAAALVRDDATVFVDAGSTCAQLVERLREHQGLTVVTRGLEIALRLAELDIETVVVGGRVSAGSHGTSGSITLFVMERLAVDVAFLGCDAVHPTRGVGEPTLEEAATKEAVARQARRTVVLAHADKLGASTVPAWGSLPSGWTLVTDETGPERLDPYRQAGVEVLPACADRGLRPDQGRSPDGP